MSFGYLWCHRRKSTLLTLPWVKDWAKRLLTCPSLIKSQLIQRQIVNSGGEVGELTFIAPCGFNGSKARLQIGSNSFVGRITMHLHAKITIGNNVVINDGALLLTASHKIDSPQWEMFAKPITLEDYAWVATNAVILPGVTIGKGSVVGAGSVVSKDVQPYTIVTGNPAQLIEKKRTHDLLYNPVLSLSFIEAWLGH